nr:MAG: p38 [Ophiovirus ranunculi]
MNIFAYWVVILEPLVCKAMAIIPHIKEIINIAFKPHNGIDILDELDQNNLTNRIKFIDQKFKYIGEPEHQNFLLDAKQRRMIIEKYNLNLNTLEEKLLADFIKPVLEEFMKKDSNFTPIETNGFLNFFKKEMEHSLSLHETVYFYNPIKESLIRDLEKGIDYLIHYNPRRVDNLLQSHGHPGNDINGRIKCVRTPDQRECITLITFMNYFSNELGIHTDKFMYQFYYYNIKYTYCLLIEIYHDRTHREKFERLTTMFDKVTIQSSIMLRVLKTTSAFDSKLMNFFFPAIPISSERMRLGKLEVGFRCGFSYRAQPF